MLERKREITRGYDRKMEGEDAGIFLGKRGEDEATYL